jgi:hypothetical protein
MKNVTDYLDRTESATRHLFDGIHDYDELIKKNPFPGQSYTAADAANFEQVSADWFDANKAQIECAHAARDEFFAKAMLSGCVLQFAHKAIELFSEHIETHSVISKLNVKSLKKIAKYCIGNEVLGIPTGLIIYAGRNHHIHYEERPHKATKYIIDKMATHQRSLPKSYQIDLEREPRDNFSSVFLTRLNWQSYDVYRKDMEAILLQFEQRC